MYNIFYMLFLFAFLLFFKISVYGKWKYKTGLTIRFYESKKPDLRKIRFNNCSEFHDLRSDTDVDHNQQSILTDNVFFVENYSEIDSSTSSANHSNEENHNVLHADLFGNTKIK